VNKEAKENPVAQVYADKEVLEALTVSWVNKENLVEMVSTVTKAYQVFRVTAGKKASQEIQVIKVLRVRMG